jgi:hypothetical protein
VFNAPSIFVVFKFGSPIAIMTLDAHRLVVNFSADGQRPFVMRLVFMPASWTVTCFALHPPKFRRDLLADKSLSLAIARCVAFKTIGIVFHPTQPGKGIGVGILLPFCEILKMTQAAFPVADVVKRVTGKGI